MPGLNLFGRALKLSLQNIRRNKILSIATIFVMGIILFIFNIIVAINFVTGDALENLSKKVDIIVYIKDGTESEQVAKIIDELQNIEGIVNITHTSKKDALIELKELHPDLSLAFEKYSLGNPLPASLKISTKNPKYHEKIGDFLKRERFTQHLSNVITENNDENNAILTSISKNLTNLTTFAQQIIFWLIITFIIGGTLIILNALHITIYSRKKEISIMNLVGASRSFIRLPFAIESVIYGVLAIAVSLIMLFLISDNIEIRVESLQKIILFEILITILLNITSSIIAVDVYLHKNSID